ncbi:hypothetical protein [Ruegeria sp. Alg231-54]|uniref:hypothetical protein n=1 Tax=Ruegeria sp. Alg231-54 TaxID=1922221 RepID=UPI000D554423|nr:hypothetical protein [Ruegeria sp. Alg231-54]
MIDQLKRLFDRKTYAAVRYDAAKQHANSADMVAVLNADPYLMVADAGLRLISVFDDLHYDRADLDMLSAPMRRRALKKLAPFEYFQRSGSVIENCAADIRIHMPKFRALGASPFDALRETSMRPQDYALLTPTQAAAQMIAAYEVDTAKERLAALVLKHPANLLRLFDFLEPTPSKAAVREMLGELLFLQRAAVAKEPLKSRRALR